MSRLPRPLSGSGFANGIANLWNASRANTTMVNIVGANATYHQRNFPEHVLINGIVDLARVVSHWAHETKSASDVAVIGALAARYSRIGAGRPLGSGGRTAGTVTRWWRFDHAARKSVSFLFVEHPPFDLLAVETPV